MKKVIMLCISAMLVLSSNVFAVTSMSQQGDGEDLCTVLESVIKQYEGTGSSLLIGITTNDDAGDITLEYVNEVPAMNSNGNTLYKPAGDWTFLGTVNGPFGLKDMKDKVGKLLASKVKYVFYIECVGPYTYNVYYKRA